MKLYKKTGRSVICIFDYKSFRVNGCLSTYGIAVLTSFGEK
jgi:hypothetical protein